MLSTDNTVKIAPMIEDSGTWFCENSTKIAQNCANDRERDENCEKEKNMRMCAMIIKDDEITITIFNGFVSTTSHVKNF